MHAAIAPLFAEHDTPTHASKRAVHDQLAPIMELVALIQKQLVEYRALATAAELAEHEDPSLNWKLGALQQPLGGAEREAAALAENVRMIARSFVQIDRALLEFKTKEAEREAAAAAPEVADGAQAAQ